MGRNIYGRRSISGINLSINLRLVKGERVREVCDNGRKLYEVVDSRLPDVVRQGVEYGFIVLWGTPRTGSLIQRRKFVVVVFFGWNLGFSAYVALGLFSPIASAKAFLGRPRYRYCALGHFLPSVQTNSDPASVRAVPILILRILTVSHLPYPVGIMSSIASSRNGGWALHACLASSACSFGSSASGCVFSREVGPCAEWLLLAASAAAR